MTHTHVAGPIHADSTARAPSWLSLPGDVNTLLPSLWSTGVDKDANGVLTVAGRNVVEIAEQLGWRAPAHVVVPCASGALMTKIARAFQELHGLDLIPEARTKMHAAQALGCGPIVTMIKNDSDVLVPVRPNTIAKSLAIGNPADGYYAYRAAKDSGGYGEHATEEEIVDGMQLLARTEGIFAETAGGVTIAATRKLIENGRIRRDEPTVICITGTGLKTPDALHDRLSVSVTIRPSLAVFDRALAELKTKGDVA